MWQDSGKVFTEVVEASSSAFYLASVGEFLKTVLSLPGTKAGTSESLTSRLEEGNAYTVSQVIYKPRDMLTKTLQLRCLSLQKKLSLNAS